MGFNLGFKGLNVGVELLPKDGESKQVTPKHVAAI